MKKQMPVTIPVAASNDFLTGIILVVVVGAVDLWESGLKSGLRSDRGRMIARLPCEKNRFSVEMFLS
jgi:hypothetical protein